MLHQRGNFHAHGGQAADAGNVVALPQLQATLRGTTQTIRVWEGHRPAEEFSVAEARTLCQVIDALLSRDSGDKVVTLTFYAIDSGAPEHLRFDRQWLIAFLAAVRRALRTLDVAQMIAPKAVRS